VLGIIDTGADCTQVPESVAQQLRLRPTGYQTFTNADNRATQSRLYVADVEFDGRTFSSTEVTGSSLPVALIGRDILNTLVAEFDGPGKAYSLR
jgi:predicted aspartyl protease